MQLGRSKSHTLGEGSAPKMAPQTTRVYSGSSDGIDNQSRSRSRSFAEKVINGKDAYAFQIPTSPRIPQKQEIRSRSKTLVEEIDLTLYNGIEEEEHVLDEPNEQHTKENIIGRMKCLIQYFKKEHIIKIEILSVDISSYPSSFVKGSTWVVKPIIKIEIKKHSDSPELVRKTSVFQRSVKQEYVMTTVGQPRQLTFKHKNPSNFTIMITIYDIDRKHKDLAIGYVHIPIDEITQYEAGINVDQIIVPNSQLLPTPHGEIDSKLKWCPSKNTIQLEIVSASNLHRSCTTSGKELYVKTIMFVGNKEANEYKTEHVEAKSDVNFNQSFHLHIEPPHQIQDVTILIQIIEKHLMSYDCIGQTLIGPYMLKTIENCNLSSWEKIIIDPNKDISHTATLTL